MRINRQILYVKLSHLIFCTKALQILSQKRVLKRNEFVGHRKEKKIDQKKWKKEKDSKTCQSQRE